jgi:hypothetical protein
VDQERSSASPRAAPDRLTAAEARTVELLSDLPLHFGLIDLARVGRPVILPLMRPAGNGESLAAPPAAGHGSLEGPLKERLALIGPSGERLALLGPSNERLALIGQSNERLALIGPGGRRLWPSRALVRQYGRLLRLRGLCARWNSRRRRTGPL